MRCRWLGWSFVLVTGLGFGGLHFWPRSAGEVPQVVTSRTPSGPAPLHAANLIHYYCGSCHTSGRAKVNFDGPLGHGELRRECGTWEIALQKLQSGEMPPAKYPQLAAEDREFLIQWLEEQLASLEPAETLPYRIRRLRQVEYRNTVRDLLGVQWQPPADFPVDERGWDLFKEPPALEAELLPPYEAAADTILAAVKLEVLEQRLDAKVGSEAERAGLLVTGIARLAYRRPLTAPETAGLRQAMDAAAGRGLGVEASVKAGLKIVLTSPRFLFRVEMRSQADSFLEHGPSDEDVLASRLSHWLWSSAPDESLLALADKHELRANLTDQARRMLKDPRARALVDDFAMTWLGLQDFAHAFPHIEPALARAMQQETAEFVHHIIQEDRSVLELLDADYTFLNARLARHYGIDGVEGEQMRRVSVKGTARGGLVTQGAFLTATSGEEHTWPVQRGKWILENLFGTPPPAPPAGLLEAFSQRQPGSGARSAREALEKHRTNASCAHCHAKIDGLGLPLESFDAQGRWQTLSFGRPVDPSAVMPDGKTIEGPVQLKAYLMDQRGLFLRCLAGKLLSHALGRKLTDHDGPALDAVVEQVVQNQHRFSSMVLAIVQSKPFQRAWGEPVDVSDADPGN